MHPITNADFVPSAWKMVARVQERFCLGAQRDALVNHIMRREWLVMREKHVLFRPCDRMCSWCAYVVKKVESDRSPHLEGDWSTEFEYHYICIMNGFRKWPFMDINTNAIPLHLLLAFAAITVMLITAPPVPAGIATLPVSGGVAHELVNFRCEMLVLALLVMKFLDLHLLRMVCITLNVALARLHVLEFFIIADCKHISICMV
jgi:hypothetical protein